MAHSRNNNSYADLLSCLQFPIPISLPLSLKHPRPCPTLGIAHLNSMSGPYSFLLCSIINIYCSDLNVYHWFCHQTCVQPFPVCQHFLCFSSFFCFFNNYPCPLPSNLKSIDQLFNLLYSSRSSWRVSEYVKLPLVLTEICRFNGTNFSSGEHSYYQKIWSKLLTPCSFSCISKTKNHGGSRRAIHRILWFTRYQIVWGGRQLDFPINS